MLWNRLKAIVDEKHVNGTIVPPGMDQALAHFETIESEFGNDFYCRWESSLVHPTGNIDATLSTEDEPKERLRLRMEMQEKLRSIWENTQDFFIARENTFLRQEKLPQLKNGRDGWAYANVPPISCFQLWRAYHSVVSDVVYEEKEMDYVMKMEESIRDERKKCREHDLSRCYGEDEGKRGPYFFEEMAFKASALVDTLPQVWSKLKHRPKGLEPIHVDEVLWMLVIRGIAWYMSVWIEPADNTALFPSSLANNKSQVWLV